MNPQNFTKKKTTLNFTFISGIINLVLILAIVLVIIILKYWGWTHNKYKEIKVKSQPNPSLSEKEDKISAKNYSRRSNCQFCQATNLLGLTEKDLPDLTQPARIGVVNSLFVRGRNLFEKGMEFLESEWLEKSTREKITGWHEHTGGKDETIVILKKTDQPLKSKHEIEKNLVIKLVENEVKEVNDYIREVIKTGVKKLLETNPSLVWEWEIYILLNNEGGGNSNGVPLLLAFLSAYYQKPVPNNISATGAVDKEGNIGAIGGLREKIIATVEAGNKTLILPADKNYDSTKNKVIVWADPKWVSEEKFTEFNQKYASKLKYRPVKNWKDLKNLLENEF